MARFLLVGEAMQLLSPSDNEGLPTVSELEDFIESHK